MVELKSWSLKGFEVNQNSKHDNAFIKVKLCYIGIFLFVFLKLLEPDC